MFRTQSMSQQVRWTDKSAMTLDTPCLWHVVPAFVASTQPLVLCRTTHPDFLGSYRVFGHHAGHNKQKQLWWVSGVSAFPDSKRVDWNCTVPCYRGWPMRPVSISRETGTWWCTANPSTGCVDITSWMVHPDAPFAGSRPWTDAPSACPPHKTAPVGTSCPTFRTGSTCITPILSA